MVLMMIQHHHHRHHQHQHQHQQTSTALPPHPVPLSTSAHRSPATPSHAQSQPPLPLAPLSSSSHRLPPPALDHVISPIASAAHHSADPAPTLARVRLSDISPYDGAPGGPYVRAVDALSGSLMRHNAAVIELGSEEASLMRCGLEAARLYFRSRSQNGVVKGCSGRGVYMYRAGRPVEDWDSSPPCMAEIFRCMGKAARSALCAIARHLRLRSE
ncbi:hypothetical protein NC651_019169 [Populus alba x Populus x berolinensis]|nr:hypothetical protein NC651_019169 [Populus alba x Populus x berolinensis]